MVGRVDQMRKVVVPSCDRYVSLEAANCDRMPRFGLGMFGLPYLGYLQRQKSSNVKE